MLDGQIWITLDRYKIEVENLPETRNNRSILECLIHLCDNKPDTTESLELDKSRKSLFQKDEDTYFSYPCNICKFRFQPVDENLLCKWCMHYAS